MIMNVKIIFIKNTRQTVSTVNDAHFNHGKNNAWGKKRNELLRENCL